MKKTARIGIALVVSLVLTAMALPAEVLAAEDDQQIKLKVSSAAAASVTLQWDKQKGVKKYRIYRSTKKTKGYKKIATVKKTKYTNKKLKEKKTYHYKVKPVKSGAKYSNTVSKVKVKGSYKKGTVYGPYMNEKQRKQVKNAVAKFVNTKIKPGMTDYEKVEKAHDYLVKRCKFADRSDRNGANSAWGALIYKEAQCSGYSRAFKALCDGMGIKCYYVHATKKAINPSHQWNIVKVGKKYYHIDVQCNDSSGFCAIYLVGDGTMKDLGLRWDTSKFPKCPEDYFK